MTRQFHYSRISKNHLGIHKDPCAAFNAGVDLRASADAAHTKKYGPKINGNDAADWADACAAIDGLDAPQDAQPNAKRKLSTPWPTLPGEALYGLAGDVVKTISPHSEADQAAILIQFLASAGNLFGRSYYYQVESDQHHANLFVALVGESAKARKGISWGRVKSVARIADEQWFNERTKGGLSSGEGFIYEVRDPVKKWNSSTQTHDVVDPGVTDKRLTIIEPEFAAALAVMERHGNTLSPLIRRAWDGDKLSALTKTTPLTATDPHISIIGHITEIELKARLTRTDAANGFANRFLFVLVKRSKKLPFGGSLARSEIDGLGERLKAIIDQSLKVGHIEVTMTDEAKVEWDRAYHEMGKAKAGLLDAITSRSEAQVIRLAMIYALLDSKTRIDLDHLKAGLAVWEYCEASAAHIFGAALGDPVADDILQALKKADKDGMTRTNIRDFFGRNQSASRIEAALANLLEKAMIRMEGKVSGGRPTEIWYAE
jgi:hypothetical protein